MTLRPAVLINDTRIDPHHGCWRVMRTLEDQLSRRGFQVVARAPAHRDWRQDVEVRRALESAALVVVNAEGTLHHDRPAGAALLAVGAEARAMGVPSALINASWQDNGPAFGAALGDFTLVAARESRSQAAMRAAGADPRLAPDLSLFETVPQPASGRREVGFTDSVVRSAAVALDQARRRLGGRVTPILYHPPGLKGGLRNIRDGITRADLSNPAFGLASVRARLAARAAEFANDRDYMARVARLRLLVTGRFHAATFALAAGTPLLAVESNTHKISATLDDAGLEPWRRIEDPARLTAADLEQAAAWTPREAASLADWIADGRRRTTALFDALAEIAL
jgi:polysaccharide pyruvyl transferase WcaK-like protein